MGGRSSKQQKDSASRSKEKLTACNETTASSNDTSVVKKEPSTPPVKASKHKHSGSKVKSSGKRRKDKKLGKGHTGGKKEDSIFTKLVNVNMVGSGVALKAAIVTHEGQIHAQSDGLDMQTDQIKTLVTAIHEDPGILANKGMVLGDEEFQYTVSKPSVVRGRSKVDNENLCTVATTRSLLLISIYQDIKQDEAEDMMTAFQSYLGDQGL